MILYIDIGNTTAKYFIKVKSKFVLINIHISNEISIHSLAVLFLRYKIQKIYFSSTKPSLNHLIFYLAKNFQIIIYNIADYFNEYSNLKNVGSDLKALTLGASKYGDSIIISLGSAITISIVCNKKLIGVNILPGIRLSFNAMVNKLELIYDYKDFKYEQTKIIGNSTESAINLGIINSSEYLINLWIDKIKQTRTKNKFRVIFTGSDSNLINLKSDQVLDKDLLLKGLEKLNKV